MNKSLALTFPGRWARVLDTGKVRGKIACVSVLVLLLLLPSVVATGRPVAPGGSPKSVLYVSGEAAGTLYSQNAPTSRTIEADGKLTLDSHEFLPHISYRCLRGTIVDLNGPHSGHITVDLSPRRNLSYFSFRFYVDLDGDGNQDFVLLHTPTSFEGTRSVEVISKNHIIATFDCVFELWVVYRDAQGNGCCGEAWFPWLTIIVDIQPA